MIYGIGAFFRFNMITTSDLFISILQFSQNNILSSDLKYVSTKSCVVLCMKSSKSDVRLASISDLLVESMHNISNFSFGSFCCKI